MEYFARPMDNPSMERLSSKPTFLLLPDDNSNSENYISGNDSFNFIETGNMRAINGKFLLACSVGAVNHRSTKLGIAYSDTFLPAKGEQYRKVMKNNPVHLWGSQGEGEEFYLLQGNENHDGWHYIGTDNGSVLTFAGYDPHDAPIEDGTNRFLGSHRRPYFTELDANVPVNLSVKQASDAELQHWITPSHGHVRVRRWYQRAELDVLA